MKKRNIKLTVLLCIIFCIFTCSKNSNLTTYTVNIVDPPFNNDFNRYESEYKMLNSAKKPWHLAVAIPHLKDDYWTGVVYGLLTTATDLGISMDIVEAGGYEYLDVQRKQIEEIIKEKPDGLIISSVSYGGLNDLVELAHNNGIPVIDLINGIESPLITSRIASNFIDHGVIIAEQILKDSNPEKKEIKIGWFPGPKGAGWVEAANKGFFKVMENTEYTILGPYYGDTGHTTQESLLKKVLTINSDIKYIAGTAVTAEVAASVLRTMSLEDKVSVSSFYYSSGVHRGILSGEITAAPTDLQAVQAKIAVDTAVRVIEGKNYYKHIEPKVFMVDTSTISTFDSSTSLAPSGFRIIMSVNAP